MLQTIRDRASGWFAYAIVFLISVPFALWGINHYLEGGGKQVAAQVGDTTISLAAFGQAYREEQARAAQMFGGQLPPSVSDKMLKQAALQRLIQETLLTQIVDDAGYKVSNQELLKQIVSFPVFQQDGHFSKTRYTQILAEQGMVPAAFEGRLRRQLAIEQFQSGVINTGFVTQPEASDALKLDGEMRQLEMTVIPISKFLTRMNITPEAIKSYYKMHQSDYMTEEKIRVSYLRLSENELAKGITPNAESLKQYYHDHLAKYVLPERAKAAEIVLRLPADKVGRDRVMTLALHILNISKRGDDFGALARQYSQDADNAKKGGAMGVVTGAGLPQPLADALFSLKPGDISKPVEVNGKLYLLRLESLMPVQQKTYAEAAIEVRRDYVAKQASTLFEKQVQRMSELTYEHPGTLETAAKSLGLQVMQSNWFSRSGGAGIASNPKVVNAAFSKQVLKDGTNSAVVEISRGDAVVLRVSDKQAPQVKPINAVEAGIKGELERVSAEGAAKQLAIKVRTAVASGKKLKNIAVMEHLSYRALGWLGRTDVAVPAEIMNAAFQVPPPSDGKPSVGFVSLNSGGYAVFAVKKIKWTDVEPTKVEALMDRKASEAGRTEMSVLFQALEKKVKIRIYPNNLNL